MNGLRGSSILLRRCYSTAPVTPEASKKLSLPLQVALRRSQQNTEDVDQDLARYELLKSEGRLTAPSGNVPSYEEWLEDTTRRRRRLRGTQARAVTETDDVEAEEVTAVVGQKIYLPNMVFRLMRNHTPPGQPYNPYEATFRVPRSITKTDIRSYLDAVYGVQCTYIRTDNYIAPITRTLINGATPAKVRIGGSETTYKRAVVGLVEPFVYPNAVEDMTAEEREEHTKWMEEMFQVDTYAKWKKEKKKDIETGKIKKRSPSRSKILELIMEKRRERETAMKTAVDELVSSGASPFGAGSRRQQIDS